MCINAMDAMLQAGFDEGLDDQVLKRDQNLYSTMLDLGETDQLFCLVYKTLRSYQAQSTNTSFS